MCMQTQNADGSWTTCGDEKGSDLTGISPVTCAQGQVAQSCLIDYALDEVEPEFFDYSDKLYFNFFLEAAIRYASDEQLERLLAYSKEVPKRSMTMYGPVGYGGRSTTIVRPSEPQDTNHTLSERRKWEILVRLAQGRVADAYEAYEAPRRPGETNLSLPAHFFPLLVLAERYEAAYALFEKTAGARGKRPVTYSGLQRLDGDNFEKYPLIDLIKALIESGDLARAESIVSKLAAGTYYADDEVLKRAKEILEYYKINGGKPPRRALKLERPAYMQGASPIDMQACVTDNQRKSPHHLPRRAALIYQCVSKYLRHASLRKGLFYVSDDKSLPP